MSIKIQVVQRKPFHCVAVKLGLVSKSMLNKCVDSRYQSILRFSYDYINVINVFYLFVDAYAPFIFPRSMIQTGTTVFKNRIDIPLWGYNFYYLTAVWKYNTI